MAYAKWAECFAIFYLIFLKGYRLLRDRSLFIPQGGTEEKLKKYI